MSILSFNVTNPGFWIDGLLTTAERTYVTNLVLAGATASENDVLTWKSGAPSWEVPTGGSGLGDVVGPALSVNNNVVTFNGTTGKLIKDSGLSLSSYATLAGNQTFTGNNTFSGTTKLTTALIGGGTAMDAYSSKGMAHAFWGSGIETRPNLNDFAGNHLMWADKRGFTITSSGPITSPNEAFRQGNTYATITNTGDVVLSAEGTITADSNVNAIRVFIQAHGSMTANLLVEVKRSDDVWVTLNNEAIALVQFQYWLSDPIINAAAYPTYWNIKGVRITISGLTQATSYLRQLGVYKPNSFYQPWMTAADPTFAGQILAPDGTVALPSYSFADDANTGIFSPINDVVSVASGGTEAFRVTGVPSSVNYLEANPAVTGGAPFLRAAGTDTNIALQLASKGTGLIVFNTNNNATRQVQISHVASAVNYIDLKGSATGGAVVMTAAGTDTNIPINFNTKGTGTINFLTGSAQQFRVANTNSAVNFIDVTGATTANGPTLTAWGSDTNVRLNLVTKGTGDIVINDAKSGNVGIGGAPVSSKLNIRDATNSIMRVDQTGNNYASQMRLDAGGIYWEFGTGATPGQFFSLDASGGTNNINTKARDFRIFSSTITTGNGFNFSQTTGNVGIGVSSPTAKLHLKAGTAAVNTAPLKLTAGVNLTTPEAGALEYDGTNLFFTPSTTRLTLADTSTAQTFSNKRITKRTGTTTSSATPTINTDNVDFYSLTAQAVDITSFTTNLSGTPTEGQTLWIAITGTAARAITWGTSFEASTVALPTTTVSTNRLDVGFVWNSVSSKWRVIATA